ncbi:hypothetical protein C6P40_004896 [Pichia californica]|uniref:Carbohydrate kinase PfkB domain-containing protein n=1 Tax=Pichia californica TaxID=460514 RepID=A0A9P6WP05_9ASCO|nr:hypothetical protein C6P42_000265 [[Candida] californica]KAG0689518.1 hypothetical protein C6P40_004896 [[Candida] californica]
MFSIINIKKFLSKKSSNSFQKFSRQLHTSIKSTSYSKVKISDEVRQAIEENKPVVALESTIITHGLPYPENVSMAKMVEGLIRQNGAVPATIGFAKGIPTVGLHDQEIELLADSTLNNVKISRRDIPNVMARGLTGGTTIAATMILANIAGIDVFSTGGLGGVSRPWSLFDVSADLDELGKTPVAVVCSGPKSILDIQRTMEYLETKGVPVATYIDEEMRNKFTDAVKIKLDNLSKSKDAKDMNGLNKFWENQKYNVPGFYVRNAGVKSPFVWESPHMAAKMIYNGKYSMELENGYVFCAPAPVEVAMDNTDIDKTIDDALLLAEKEGIFGKELTPFLLQTLYEKTNGESAKCNIAFVKNNTILGSLVATELSNLKGGHKSQFQPYFKNEHSTNNIKQMKSVKQVIDDESPDTVKSTIKPANAVVVGSVAVDTMCKLTSENFKSNDSNPGKVKEKSIGGVGFNVALAATAFNLDNPVPLITAINEKDSAGTMVFEKFIKSSIPQTGLINYDNDSTAQYVSIHRSDGELEVACADMDIIEKIDSQDVCNLIEKISPKYVLFDTNISIPLMDSILMKSMQSNINVIVEPTSGIKCKKLSECNLPIFPNTPIKLITPTVSELSGIHESFKKQGKFDDIDSWFNVLDSIGASEAMSQLVHSYNKFSLISKYINLGIFQQAFQLLPYFPNIIIKDGSNGVLLVQICQNADDARSYINSATRKINTNVNDFTVISRGGRYDLAVVIQHFKAIEIDSKNIVNVTGAGDCLVGCLLAQLSNENDTALSESLDNIAYSVQREKLIMTAQRAAITSLVYDGAVDEKSISTLKAISF